MDDAVRAYIDAINAAQRPVFDRLDRLIREEHPDVEVVLSYQIPTFKVGDRRLYVGAWKQWVSLYGWGEGRDGGFMERHPELSTGKGTLQLRPAAAADLSDDELRQLVRGALSS
jgi:uncharacterized protein YdhG (YjbR/CyaY superfamily)